MHSKVFALYFLYTQIFFIPSQVSEDYIVIVLQ